ncbi:MAG TPA: VOC family protein [Candidatus Acidoferrales bacterium]|nr:VOC family protein [Candidatus Acidoferrales bacterium]
MKSKIAELRTALEDGRIGRRIDGRIDRRGLIKALGLGAAAAFAASVSPEAAAWTGGEAAQAGMAGTVGMSGGMALKAVSYNHINYQVTDYAKVRDFYVSVLGMRDVWDDGKQCSVECGNPPNAIYIRPLTKPLDRPAGNWSEQMGQGNVDHFAFSIENFELEPVRAELARRGLEPKPDGAYAWSIKDPDGTTIQICAIKGVFPGAASPTAKESDGTKNLSAIPGPDSNSFKSYAVSHLVYNVPDVERTRDFYMNLLGMKLVYFKPGGVFGVDAPGGPVCFLRFGENFLYLRKSQHPDNKPYVAHFALAVENYNQAAVKAELERRGFKPHADTKYAWTIQDPAGMRTEIAGRGMPEHVGGDCNGGNAGCPGGPDK